MFLKSRGEYLRCIPALRVPALVGEVVKTLLPAREVLGLIRGPLNRTHCRQRLTTTTTFLWSCGAQMLSRRDGPPHLLHASA